MRILMACAAFPPFMDGGGPVSARLVAQTLQNAGHEVQVVNIADEAGDEIRDGVLVRRLKTLNIYWNYRRPQPAWKRAVWHLLENGNPRAFFAMRREIRRVRPDIVLTDSIENINVATWAAARVSGVPVCHILRSTFLLCWKASMMRGDRHCEGACLSCRATSLGKRWLSGLVDAVVGESAFIVGLHHEQGYFPRAIERVIPGVLPEVAAAPERAERGGGPLRVGYIGVHTPLKGLDTLAEAAQALAGRCDIQFVVAGAGSDEYARALPARFPQNTRFLGWTDPDAFFPQVDVLVVPSLFREPFGRVVIEAFAHGVPVLGARSGGIAELVEDGVNGFTFPSGDATALVGGLLRFADDPAQLQVLSSGALASTRRYSPAAVAAGFDTLFNTLLTRRSAVVTRPAEEALS